MLHGDISNQRSYNIGFRVENTLLLPRKGILDLIPNLLRGEWKNAKVDEEVLVTMSNIYWNTEYTVSLVVDDEVYRRNQIYFEDFPFNQAMNVIRGLAQITLWLNTGQMTYFVTNDIMEKSLVNSPYALTHEEFLRDCPRLYKSR